MSWGNPFKTAWNAATDVAKQAVAKVASGVSGAAAWLENTANKLGTNIGQKIGQVISGDSQTGQVPKVVQPKAITSGSVEQICNSVPRSFSPTPIKKPVAECPIAPVPEIVNKPIPNPTTSVPVPNPTKNQSRVEKNEQKIAELHPAVQGKARAFLKKAEEAGFELRITEAQRSIEKQNSDYAKGRDANGKVIDPKVVVTNAKGGQSFHNYGLAFGVYDEKKGWETDWKKLSALGAEAGLEWGGEWPKLKDRPHFQYTGGLDISEVQKGKRPAD